MIIANLKSSPPIPLSKISLGPVGQSEDIINFFNATASRRTFGDPSYFEDNTNKSLFFMYGYGFFRINNFNILGKFKLFIK